MKIIHFGLVFISTGLLVVNQIALKFWLSRKNIIVWPLNTHFARNIFSIEILVSILSIIISGFIWLFLLKKIQFSILYPMISISYVFGLFVSTFVFHETIPPIRWIGVMVIIIGVFLVSRG